MALAKGVIPWWSLPLNWLIGVCHSILIALIMFELVSSQFSSETWSGVCSSLLLLSSVCVHIKLSMLHKGRPSITNYTLPQTPASCPPNHTRPSSKISLCQFSPGLFLLMNAEVGFNICAATKLTTRSGTKSSCVESVATGSSQSQYGYVNQAISGTTVAGAWADDT